MPEINLLQNRLQDTTYVSVRRTKTVVYLALFLLLLILGGGAGLYVLTNDVNTQKTAVLQSNADLQKQLTEGNSKLGNATTYQAKLSNVETLLTEHIFISPLLAEIEKYTYLKARFVSVDLDQSTGKIHIDGVVDSYQGLGKLLLALSTSPNFKNVKLLSVSPAGTGFTFGVDMVANKDLFSKTQ